MSEHSEGSTLTEQDKANAAFIIEACNNYEAVKKERDELREAVKWFVERCDMGEVRSVKTYDKFKSILDKHNQLNQ